MRMGAIANWGTTSATAGDQSPADARGSETPGSIFWMSLRDTSHGAEAGSVDLGGDWPLRSDVPKGHAKGRARGFTPLASAGPRPVDPAECPSPDMQVRPMRIVSWNVNGVRAAERKGFLDWLHGTRPDIVGLQETKAAPEQLSAALLAPDGYHTFWASAERRGYSGVALLTRRPPREVRLGLGIPEYDREGRTIIADFDDFVFITTYTPNGGNDHARVPYKMGYKAEFQPLELLIAGAWTPFRKTGESG